MRIIRAQLEGADAAPGRVAAADVARIILGIERAIARAAYLVLGRPRRGTGRHSQAIESAARLRFVGVDKGSFVGILALPDAVEPSEGELPISVADLSSQAFGRLLATITSTEPDTDAELAVAIAKMAADLGIGDRNTSITLSDESVDTGGDGPRRATIDVTVREQMQQIGAQSPPIRDETLVGVLFEADFEAHTARLRLAGGGVVTVSFSEDLADDIYEALRTPTRVEGFVRYHPRTNEVAGVELRAVIRNTQPSLDFGSFWRADTFVDLQSAQGRTGLIDPEDLVIRDLADDERVAFLATLAE